MKTIIFAVVGFVLLQPHYVKAHGDHDSHGYQEPIVISENVAIIIAQRATTSMTKKDAGLGFGQLSESWAAIAKEDASVFQKGNGYYVVAIAKKQEESTLYMLMSDRGEVYDANLTGKFDGIE